MRRPLLSLFLLPLFLEGCSNESDPTPLARADALDLLVRQPDTAIEQPGLLAPRPGEDWGGAGRGGWARLEPGAGWVLPDGSHYIEANQPIAALELVAAVPEDRELLLELWLARAVPASKGALELRLNGQTLPGVEPLTGQRVTLRVAVPRELWRAGSNRLELEVPASEEPDATGRHWDTLAVARVTWGEERRLTYDLFEQRYQLPSGTGARYLVETTGAAELDLAARAAGSGRLAVRLGTVDARTGDEAGVPRELALDVDGELRHTLPLLAAPAGEIVALELTWIATDGAALELVELRVREEEPVRRPPVLLISIDTLSARHVSVYGYGRETTPELEELARDAVVFERCVANAPWTLPSYLSALTGLYPTAHRARRLVGDSALDNYDYWQVADNRWTLAEALRARGYQTAASLDTAWLSPRFKIDQGFDLYDIGPSMYGFFESYYGIRYIRDQFERYLDELRDPDAPFFAFIHALDAHGPFWPEEGFLDLYADDLPEDLRPTLAGSAPQTFGTMPAWMAQTLCPDEHRPRPEGWPIPREVPLEVVIARYDETIRKTDHSIGSILDLLKSRGLYDDAVVIVTGDHGESFAHENYSHGVLWEDVISVPLIVKLPGNERGGTRVAQSVQLVDLYPTLFELVGAGAPRDYLHGRSLLPLARGRAGSSAPRPTFSEGGLLDQRMIESGGWKLVEQRPGHQPGLASLLTDPRVPPAWIEEHVPELAETGILTEELRVAITERKGFQSPFRELARSLEGPYYLLFDLNADPNEERDLAAEHPEKVAELLRLMRAHEKLGTDAQSDAKLDGTPVKLSEEDLARLRALGYTGDE